MDCLTEILKSTLDAMAGRKDGVVTPIELHQFCDEVARAPSADRPALIEQIGRIMAERDNYQNPPAWYVKAMSEAVRLRVTHIILGRERDHTKGGDDAF